MTDERNVMTQRRIDQHRAFAQKVAEEVKRQKERFPADCHSLHEGYGVLLEEVDELWDWVREKQGLRVRSEILEELVQIAAYAARIAAELDFIEPPSEL